MADRIEILVSNDDGFRAPGIRALMRSLMEIGNVTVVAPDSARSGFSSAITSTIPITMKLRHQEEGLTVYSSTGTPVDCVKVALNTIFAEKKPDILVSGINHGRNDGICVLYSGTIGVAMEGSVCGIQSLAVSLNNSEEEPNMGYAAEYANKVVKHMLKYPVPENTLLSLNVPDGKPLGLKVCRMTNGRFTNEYMRSQNAKGKEVFWMQGKQINKYPDIIGDLEYLEKGYAALTPIKIEMTNFDYLPLLEKSFSTDSEE